MVGEAVREIPPPPRGFNSDACLPTLVLRLGRDEPATLQFGLEYISSISWSNNYVVDDAVAGGSQLRATTDRT